MSRRFRQVWLAALGVAVIILSGAGLALAGPSSSAFASTTVNGGGSSFAAPEALQWASEVAGPPDHLTINYTNSSSGNGRIYYANGNWDYGATDIIFNAEDQGLQNTVQQSHPFKYVTVSAGGLAFEYNIVIDGVKFTNLELTRQDVCGIFTGEITRWNQIAGTAPSDGALASLPPNTAIKAVVRSDSAGESYVLSQYCLAVDPGDWNNFKSWVDSTSDGGAGYSDPNLAAGQPVSYWPGVLAGGPNHISDSALAASGAPAVAEDADSPNTPFAITYVATAYALQLGAPVARVQNGAGQFTLPTPNSIQIALSYAHANAAGTFDLNFTGSNAQAYFPSTYSYVLDPTTPHSGINGPLNQWLCYDIGAGQNDAAPLDYAPLSRQVTALSVAAIEATPNAPPASECGVGGPQPNLIAPGVVTPIATGPKGGFPGSNNAGGTASAGGSGSSSAAGAGSSGTSSSGSGSGATVSSSGATPSAARSLRGKARAGTRSVPGSQVTSSGGTAAGNGSDSSLRAGGIEAVSQTGPTSSPAPDQALWWVLGGFILAAGATGITGLTRRERS